MIVNIVDTKGDFKKAVANNENPTSIDEAVQSIENIQRTVGKKIMLDGKIITTYVLVALKAFRSFKKVLTTL